jgi:opacity protein-like surface antigen
MTSKLKIMTAAALIAAGIASPAFAQSADHTGSQLPSYYDSVGKQAWGSWGPVTAATYDHPAARRSGLNAFAAVPGNAPGSFSPQATGGGSIGYNQNLRTDQ